MKHYEINGERYLSCSGIGTILGVQLSANQIEGMSGIRHFKTVKNALLWKESDVEKIGLRVADYILERAKGWANPLYVAELAGVRGWYLVEICKKSGELKVTSDISKAWAESLSDWGKQLKEHKDKFTLRRVGYDS